MCGEEVVDTVLVLLSHEGTGRIDQPAAGPHETGGTLQDAGLQCDQRLQPRTGRPPARIRVAAPRAGAAARRVDEHAVEAALVALHPRIELALQRPPLDIVDAGAPEPLARPLQPLDRKSTRLN